MKYPFPVRNYIDSLVVSDYYLDIGNDFLSRSIREYQGLLARRDRIYPTRPCSVTQSRSKRKIRSSSSARRDQRPWRNLFSSSQVTVGKPIYQWMRKPKRSYSTTQSRSRVTNRSTSESRTERYPS